MSELAAEINLLGSADLADSKAVWRSSIGALARFQVEIYHEDKDDLIIIISCFI